MDRQNTSKTLGGAGAPLEAALVVVSDIHLHHLGDERGQLLMDVVKRLGPSVEYLVLNGDIFDFCFGDGAYFQRKFQALGEALAAAAKRGIRIVFLEGNHEFHMAAMSWDGVEIVTDRDYVVTLAKEASLKIKISHGDLIKDDPLYKAFRGLVKSRVVRHLAGAMPGRLLDAYSLRHAKISRSQDKYRKLDHGRILQAFNRWLSDGDFDHGIIGHFHVPYAERRETHDGLMLSVESWDRPNLLVYQGGGFHRVFLDKPGEPFRLSPVESIFKLSAN